MAEEPDRRHPVVVAARQAIEDLEVRRADLETALAGARVEVERMPVTLGEVERAIERLRLPESLENAEPAAFHRLLQSIGLEVRYTAPSDVIVRASIPAALADSKGGKMGVGGGI